MTEKVVTTKVDVEYIIEYPDPDGDWVVYARGTSEEKVSEGVRDLRVKHPHVKWRMVRQIASWEVLDV